MNMRVLKTSLECSLFSKESKTRSLSVGFVPTMGNLHKGHLSLIRIAKQQSDVVILSVFVNPLQFSANEDYDTYPRTLEKDISLAREMGCDAVFCPSKDEFALSDLATQVYVPEWGQLYCGKTRPHFFQGVCSIVLRLFNIVQPDIAVFGEKDFQQLTIIKKMVLDLFLPIKILSGPIIREVNGLAMSSRNHYLSDQKKEVASKIYDMMQKGRHLFDNGQISSENLIKEMQILLLATNQFRLDYLTIVNTQLNEVSIVNKEDRILVAAYLDDCRLIDNLKI